MDHRQVLQVFSDDPDFLEQVESALSLVSGFAAGRSAVSEFLAGRAAQEPVTLVIVDVDDGRHLSNPRLYEARRALNPGTGLIVVSRELSPEQLRDIVRLNSGDWLRKPVDRRELLKTIANALKQRHADQADVRAYVSGAASSGASTLAINAAYLAAKGGGKKARGDGSCILFELDFAAGACGYYLDIENSYDLTAVLESPSRIDIELVDIICKQHPEGFHLLSLKIPTLLTHPAAEEVVLRLLDVLSLQYQVVVLDVPYYAVPWRAAVLAAVDRVAIVTDPVIPALKQARDLWLELRAARNPETVTIIVNKFKSTLFSRNLSKGEIGKIFDGAPVNFLPDDWNLMSEAANRGLVPFALNPRSAFGKAARKILA